MDTGLDTEVLDTVNAGPAGSTAGADDGLGVGVDDLAFGNAGFGINRHINRRRINLHVRFRPDLFPTGRASKAAFCRYMGCYSALCYRRLAAHPPASWGACSGITPISRGIRKGGGSLVTDLVTMRLVTVDSARTWLQTIDSLRTGLRTAILRTDSAQISYRFRSEINQEKCQLLIAPHGLRFAFGRKPLMAALALPASEVGPVLGPPWNLHRPFSQRSVRLHGVPARVFAPQMSPRNSSGYSGKVGGG